MIVTVCFGVFLLSGLWTFRTCDYVCLQVTIQQTWTGVTQSDGSHLVSQAGEEESGLCDPAGLPVGLELVLVEPDRQTLYQLEGEQYPGDVWYGGEGVLHQQRRDTFFIGRSAMQM